VAQWDKVIVIPGTKNIKYLEENFGARKVRITEEEEREVRDLVSSVGISGSRDPFFGQFVDTAPL
jgi:aryl-alcohol dehydrogenase-like predicted oxidoreductase